MIKLRKIVVLVLITCTSAKDVGNLSILNCQRYLKALDDLNEDAESFQKSRSQLHTRIIGGTETIQNAYPHMAVIGFGSDPNDNLKYQCGGTLISETFVLTAAHCLQSMEHGPAQKVRLGVTRLRAVRNRQEIAISERIPHPDYKPPIKYNDIALLRLAFGIVLTSAVRPTCLNVEERILTSVATATGFGKLSYEADSMSPHLMEVELYIIPNEVCNKSYSKSSRDRRVLPRGVADSMLCAGNLNGGFDTCQGDSGGPLVTMLSSRHRMHLVIGVTSFGKYCGFANSPGVYTRVSYYIDWLENIVWGE